MGLFRTLRTALFLFPLMGPATKTMHRLQHVFKLVAATLIVALISLVIIAIAGVLFIIQFVRVGFA